MQSPGGKSGRSGSGRGGRGSLGGRAAVGGKMFGTVSFTKPETEAFII